MDLDQYKSIIGIMERIEQKWAVYILFTLFINNALGFNDLKKKVKPVSSKMLSIRLKELQGIGLISRNILFNIPKRVEYTLTEEGEKLLSFLAEFGTKMKT